VRVLLDEQIPIDLAGHLPGHAVSTVRGRGWAGVTNGELLFRMAGQIDAFVTMDRRLEEQHDLSVLAFGTVIVRAPSNRMQHLVPLVPAILAALGDLGRGDVRRIPV
jgi:hypothetical protein